VLVAVAALLLVPYWGVPDHYYKIMISVGGGIAATIITTLIGPIDRRAA
jgi:hypothetical protein